MTPAGAAVESWVEVGLGRPGGIVVPKTMARIAFDGFEGFDG